MYSEYFFNSQLTLFVFSAHREDDFVHDQGESFVPNVIEVQDHSY